MITYHCDRCGKEIVNGAIYREAITVESVGTPNMIEAMEVMFEGGIIEDRCYCRDCKEKIKSFLYGEMKEPEEPESPNWKARMLEKFQKRV